MVNRHKNDRYISRFLHGLIYSVRLGYLFIKLSMPSTESKLEERKHRPHLENYSITAVTPCHLVSPCFHFTSSSDGYFICNSLISFHFTVFVVMSVCIALKLGEYPRFMFFFYFCGITAFYCSHWQTYVSGKFRGFLMQNFVSDGFEVARM